MFEGGEGKPQEEPQPKKSMFARKGSGDHEKP